MSHSEIPGSTLTFSSPEHFVACHVLHRRFEPSHPSNGVPKMLIYIWLINMIADDIVKDVSSYFQPFTAKNKVLESGT